MEILIVRWGWLALSMAVLPGVVAARPDRQATFRTDTALVVETVTVLNADGRPVEGLQPSDFEVLEDGTPQPVAFAEFQRLRDDPLPPDVPAPTPRISEVPAATAQAISSSRPGEIRYRDRRLLVLYFDLPAMPPADRLRTLWSADTFISTQMSASDLVAIVTFDGEAVRVKQDFTGDRESLREVIRRLIEGNDRDGDGVPDEPEDESTPFGQNGGEFNVLRTDRQLSALQTAVTMLERLTEQKTLLYFVSGLRMSGLDNQAQLRATVNAAIRSNVSINPIDARGLVAEAPMGNATVASPAGIGLFTGAPAQAMRDRIDRSQDTLYGLAKDTGGIPLFDYNDLTRGIRQAAAGVRSYYILGYYTTRSEKDGRFRRVRVSVAGHPAARVTYRRGYFAEKAFAAFNGVDKERQLEDALMLEDPITEIPLALEVNYFQLNRSEYFVPVSVKLPGKDLALDGSAASGRVRIDIIGEVKDERGVTVQNVRDKLEIPLSADTAAHLRGQPVQYETGFTLLPGEYAIKLLVRDGVSGRIGTFETHFAIPNLTRETSTLRVSSVVLGTRRVSREDALFNVRQKTASDQRNPLVVRGVRLVPSVTRVFRPAGDLYVLFDVYRADGITNGPLAAYVALYRDGSKIRESEPRKTPVDGAVVPFEFTVPLEGLSTGVYDCQVSLLDFGRQKVWFWRAPIDVVP